VIHSAAVPYRRTPTVAARLSSSRVALLAAALSLVAEGGYAAASPAAVTRRAEVATGTLYRHFPSKSALLAEVFRRASERELAVVRAAGAASTGARAGVAAVVEAFARRALRGGRLAYALLSEPVDPAVEAERLVFRRDYRDLLAAIVAGGVASGELPAQHAETTAAALVGAIAEALVGPLSRTASGGRAAGGAEADALVSDLVRFCVTALG
jgi:AcrR family transcriptional regulator